MQQKEGTPAVEEQPKLDGEEAEGTTNSYLVFGTRFQIDKRYHILDPMGSGAYGVVVAAQDQLAEEEANKFVAIKKIEKPFENTIFMQRTLRELKVLRLLDHENVISIKTILKPPKKEEFEDIYVVNELMETDLAAIIKSKQGLSDDHI